jgi:hypothetical protein
MREGHASATAGHNALLRSLESFRRTSLVARTGAAEARGGARSPHPAGSTTNHAGATAPLFRSRLATLRSSA